MPIRWPNAFPHQQPIRQQLDMRRKVGRRKPKCLLEVFQKRAAKQAEN
jgi:hypothetical protein